MYAATFFVSLAFVLTALTAIDSKRNSVDIHSAYELLVEHHGEKTNHLPQENNNQKDLSCELDCPLGKKISSNPESSPIINGCGSYNITLDFRLLGLDAFTQCCNSHDLCYDTCSQTKDLCDRSFARCLIQSCDSYAVQNSWASVQKFTCESTAKIMSFAVDKLGCSAYFDSRKRSCTCA